MDVDELIIECVREEKVLYDPNEKKYMDTYWKAQIWRNIATKCGISSGDAAKNIWKRLRDGYRSSKKRKASGSAASSTSRWKYEMQMSFLQPFMKDRLRTTNSEEGQRGEEIQTQEMLDSLPLQDSVATDTQHPSSEEDNVPLPSSKSETMHSSTSASKKNNDKSVLHFLQQEAKKKEERSNRREEIRRTLLQQDDPLKTFFDSMYGTTKTLPVHLQRKIKKGIFLMVTEAEEQAEGYATCLSNSSSVMSRSLSPASNSAPVFTDLDQPVANHSTSNEYPQVPHYYPYNNWDKNDVEQRDRPGPSFS